jgi:hypothetical protein
MISRQTHGPEAAYERSGQQLYREVRSPGARLVEALKGSASGFILAAAAIAVAPEPATIDLVIPLSCLYATWVLTHRVVLPLRLPQGAHRKD